MANTFQLPEDVTNARANAQNLTSVANQYSAAEPSVSDVLRQRVQEAYSNNQDIIGPLDTATANYYSAPSQAREKYLTPGSANYLQNPFAAERMVSEYTNQQAVPMLSYGNILGQRMGRIQDLIGTGVNAWEVGKNSAIAKAQEARQVYEDSLNEYLQLQNLELEQQRIDKSGSGSGGAFSLAALEDLLAKFGVGGQTQEQDDWEVVQPKPTTEADLNKDYVFGNYQDPLEKERAKRELFGGISGVDFSNILKGGVATGGF